MIERRRVMGNNDGGYVKDGLIFWLDGINKGNDDTAWTDLVGGIKFPYNNNVIINNNNIRFVGKILYSDIPRMFPWVFSTIEVVCDFINTGVVFMPCAADNICFGFYRNTIVHRSRERSPIYPTYTNDKYFSISSIRGYINGIEIISQSSDSWNFNNNTRLQLGGRDTGTLYYGSVYSIRIYNKLLTQDEILYNYNIDKERFNL